MAHVLISFACGVNKCPLALYGVAMCGAGNLAVVPIIKMIGMTMGLTVWGVTNMLTGWVIGTFILKQSMTCKEVSYGGIALVIIRYALKLLLILK